MKPVYKWILVGVILIVLGTAAGLGLGYYILHSEVPKLNETIRLPGLEKPVEVVFDKWGVPHVYGESDLDLIRALGYLHARDRLWQMDLVRHAAAGRLSEIFGEPLYETDVMQRVIGLERFARKGMEKLDAETVSILKAYSDGVNDFIKTHPEQPTFEYKLIGYKMEPWKPEDTVMLARMTGWQLSGNMQEELLRYALVIERGDKMGWQLLPRHKDPGPYIIPEEEKCYTQGARLDIPEPTQNAAYDSNDASAHVGAPLRGRPSESIIKLLQLNDQLRQNIGAIAGNETASNSWVVSPQKSASGGAMLCNDPHLDHMLPSVWHEAHLTGKNINVAGVAFAGTPFIILGHTPKIAWGATTTMADTQDLYIIKENSETTNEYMFDGKYIPFEVADEKIRVRKKNGFDEKTVKVRITRHGPVITDLVKGLPKGLPPLALRWAGYETSNEAKAVLNMAKATSWKEFLAALEDMKVPVQNWVYADVNGNIGYIANGLIPIRGKGSPGLLAMGEGTLPVPGDDPAYEWKGFIPQENLPQLYNPKSGYIATANNKVVLERTSYAHMAKDWPGCQYPYYVSLGYAPPYRATRITELLKSKEKLGVQDMSDIQMDTKLLLGQRLAKYFIDAYEKKGDKSNQKLAKAVESLKNWDFFTPVSSLQTLFFLESYRQAFRLTYEDEMSKELFENYREARGAFNAFDNGVETDFPLFDDRSTPVIETRDDVLAKAMSEAIKQLSTDMGEDTAQWKWGARHTVLFNHPFGQIEALRKLLSLGPYELSGSRDTVNNGYFYWFVNPYRVWEGPSMRHIVDYGRIDDSGITITVGQSGHRLSPHYSDQVKDWLAGRRHPMPLTREGVNKIAEGSIKFTP